MPQRPISVFSLVKLFLVLYSPTQVLFPFQNRGHGRLEQGTGLGLNSVVLLSLVFGQEEREEGEGRIIRICLQEVQRISQAPKRTGRCIYISLNLSRGQSSQQEPATHARSRVTYQTRRLR